MVWGTRYLVPYNHRLHELVPEMGLRATAAQCLLGATLSFDVEHTQARFEQPEGPSAKQAVRRQNPAFLEQAPRALRCRAVVPGTAALDWHSAVSACPACVFSCAQQWVRPLR